MKVVQEANGIRAAKTLGRPHGAAVCLSARLQILAPTSPCAVPNRPLGLRFRFKDEENTKISEDSDLSLEKKHDTTRGGIAFDLQGSSQRRSSTFLAPGTGLL